MGSAIRGGWLVKSMWLVGLGMLVACGDGGAAADGDGSDEGDETLNVDGGADETGGDGDGDGDGDTTAEVDGGTDAAVVVTINPLAMADGSDGCEPGQLLDDAEQCVEACSLFDCGDHGACEFDPETAAVACVCEDGNYAGDHCESCSAAAYDDGNGNCTDPCAELDCGSGTCGFDGDGATHCTCPEGEHLVGDHCELCAPGYEFERVDEGVADCILAVPAETNMKVWLDADNDSSLGLVNSTSAISAWTSLLSSPLTFLPPSVNNRPAYNDAMVGTAQAAVVFTGAEKDALGATFNMGGSYSVFVVLKASDDQVAQTILGGVDAMDNIGFWLRTTAGTNLQISHKVAGVTESVTINDLALTERSLIEVHRGGISLTAIAGGQTKSVVLSANPLPSLDYELGRHPGTTTYPFSGSIHEIIVVSPAVSNANLPAYRDDLKAKWAL